jgi:mannose-6-phosphate isomerase-like protein (cupin superfamily)
VKLKYINEHDFQFRNGDSGVKYLMRGPTIDWGVIVLKPGESMAKVAHGHHQVDETFYFAEGSGLMIVDAKEIPAPQGSVFYIEPKELHNIRNNSDKNLKVVFIKGTYSPDDKFE